MFKGTLNISYINKCVKALLHSALCVAAIFASFEYITPSLNSAEIASMVVAVRSKDKWPPEPVTDLRAEATATEGQVKLLWTAPNENLGLTYQAPVSGYFIRYSTYSVDILSGDTTAWWNNAGQITITGAGMPGTAEVAVINLPLPGTTYYFAIKSYDDAEPTPNVSEIDVKTSMAGQQARAYVFDQAPSKPTGLSLIESSTYYAKIGWNELTPQEKTSDFDHYGIYRSSVSENSDFTLIGISTVPYFIDGSIVSDTMYYYRVNAVDKPPLVLSSDLSEYIVLLKTLILAPKNLAAKAEDRKITLTWERNTESQILGYYIYRSAQSGVYGAATLNSSPIEGTYFEDTNVSNGYSYYYVIKAVSISKELSNYSNEVSAVPRDNMAPAAVLGVDGILSADRGSMIVNWSPVTFNEDLTDCSDLTGYEVYRSLTLDGTYTMMGFVPAGQPLVWNDPESVKGKIFFYALRAKDSSGNLGGLSMVVNSSLTMETILTREDDLTTYVSIPKSIKDILYKDTNQYGDDLKLEIIKNVGEENGDIIKSRTFVMRKRVNGEIIKNFVLPQKVQIVIGYADKKAAISRAIGSEQIAEEKNISLYWHNGLMWLNLGGEIDTELKALSIKTKRLGKYAVRRANRSDRFGILSIQPEKTFTPNGDGWNDYFEINFDNPQDANIIGRIYDMRGALVSDMKKGASNISLSWDGKNFDGSPAPGGVYIYQIQVTGTERKVLNGTCIIAR